MVCRLIALSLLAAACGGDAARPAVPSSFAPGGPTDRFANEQHADVTFLARSLDAATAAPRDVLTGAVRAGAGYAVTGHSTGGTISLVAAYAPDVHDDRVRAVAALAPCACF